MTEQRTDPHADDPNWGYHPWQVGPSELIRGDREPLGHHLERAEAGRKAHAAICEHCRLGGET